MPVPKSIHLWGTLGLASQLVIYVIPYTLAYEQGILDLVRNYDSIVLAAGSLVAFCFLAVGHRKTCEEKKSEGLAPTVSDQAREAVKILSSLFAVIAGLSLTTAIKEFSSLKDVFSGLETTIIFFSTALPFYNGATMFLVTNYYSKGFEGRRTEPLIDFLMLFSEAAALYGMAVNITNYLGFIVSFSILLVIDVMWVSFILVRKWRSEVPHEWLWLDFYMLTLFLAFWFLTKPYMAVLAVVAIFRTIIDYYVARRYYLP